jgi:hypothetical protein
MPFNVDFTFDEKSYRHYLNGQAVVMHSHHYLALLTKLAEDLDDINGPQILADTVEDSMRAIFEDYFQEHAISDPKQKAEVCTGYFSSFGLGKMTLGGNEECGEAKLSRSHLDEGWLKKWGAHHKPINHFTRGYVAAVFAAVFNRPTRSYLVTETVSMAAGEEQGVFVAKAT